MLRMGIPGSVFLSDLIKKDFVSSTNKFGVKLHLDPREYLEKEVILAGYYEEEVIGQLVTVAKALKNPIIWDIGANVGLHSLTLKKEVPSSRIYCFEPYHVNFTKFMKNQSLNPGLDLKIFNFGLSESLEINKIYTTQTNSGRTSFMPLEHTSDSSISILSCSGDYLVENNILPFPNIIKIDVEGMELSVLKGCASVLANPKLKSIIFERPTNLSPDDEVVSLLESYGFEINLLERSRLHEETNRNYVGLRSIEANVRVTNQSNQKIVLGQ